MYVHSTTYIHNQQHFEEFLTTCGWAFMNTPTKYKKCILWKKALAKSKKVEELCYGAAVMYVTISVKIHSHNILYRGKQNLKAIGEIIHATGENT